jgi:quercetin dioxygenase-like cupin family protein
MKVINYRDVEAQQYDQAASEEIAKGVRVRPLITEEDGSPNFVMDYFELAPGGFTPLHSHPWEHQVFVMGGRGTVRAGEAERPIGPGSVVLVTSNEEHQFRNPGSDPLEMVCVIPTKIARLINLL